MLTNDDLSIINKALASGADVRIQNTPNGGYRIVSDTVKVLRKSSYSFPVSSKAPDNLSLSPLAKAVLSGERILPDTI